jgi:hypothetical protein
VRRRVQFFSALTIIGWTALLAAVWMTAGSAGIRVFDYPVTLMAFGAILIGLGLVWFSILEVRRLPSESEVGRLSRYPRRLP